MVYFATRIDNTADNDIQHCSNDGISNTISSNPDDVSDNCVHRVLYRISNAPTKLGSGTNNSLRHSTNDDYGRTSR
jgi:hypothetical protein